LWKGRFVHKLPAKLGRLEEARRHAVEEMRRAAEAAEPSELPGPDGDGDWLAGAWGLDTGQLQQLVEALQDHFSALVNVLEDGDVSWWKPAPSPAPGERAGLTPPAPGPVGERPNASLPVLEPDAHSVPPKCGQESPAVTTSDLTALDTKIDAILEARPISSSVEEGTSTGPVGSAAPPHVRDGTTPALEVRPSEETPPVVEAAVVAKEEPPTTPPVGALLGNRVAQPLTEPFVRGSGRNQGRSLWVSVSELPQHLSLAEAVALAYPTELAELDGAVRRGLPCLVECARDLAPFLFVQLQERRRAAGQRCLYLDSRPDPDDRPQVPAAPGLGRALARLRAAVRGPVEEHVFVVPNLDLLAGGGPAGLTAEAREVIALLAENPEVLWVGLYDPVLPLPRALEELTLLRLRVHGVACDRLRYLVTRAEGRKFGEELDVTALHLHVSGVSAVRLRRLLSTLDREDLPFDPARALAELRRLTLPHEAEAPAETLNDVGGERCAPFP
jgi:hypothetical protein